MTPPHHHGRRRHHHPYIRYEPGGFFSRHQDYLSVTSNVITEFTLIVNVNADNAPIAEGGQTVITANESNQLTSESTTTFGRGLLFRKV